MRNLRTGKIRAHLVTSVGMLALTAGAALAQSAPAQQANAEDETVIVSASRISIAGYQEPTPVSVIDSGQLQQAANADIGQTLRQLPMMGTAQSPQNGTQGNAGNSGAVGISSINLRNLGVTRTLWAASGMLTGWGVRGRSAISLHDLREFRLVADRPLPFEVDGDYLGERDNVLFTSVPSAIRVIC